MWFQVPIKSNATGQELLVKTFHHYEVTRNCKKSEMIRLEKE